MFSDVYQIGYSAPEYTIIGRIIDDILKKIVDLISVISSRFGVERMLKEKDTWFRFQSQAFRRFSCPLNGRRRISAMASGR